MRKFLAAKYKIIELEYRLAEHFTYLSHHGSISISRLHNLRDLALTLPSNGIRYAVHVPFVGPGDILFDPVVTLRSLKLENFVTREDELLQVVTAHRSTLKSLHLGHVHLSHGGSWLRVLRRLRGVMELESAEFDHLYWWRGDPPNPGAAHWQVNAFFYDDAPSILVGRVDGTMQGKMGEYLVRGGKNLLER